jgi:hypothetical protein
MTSTNNRHISRRNFLKVSATGGAVLFSVCIPGLRGSATLEAANGVFEPNVWVKIGADDSTTITLSMLEMGQGVMTSMPMLSPRNSISTGARSRPCGLPPIRVTAIPISAALSSPPAATAFAACGSFCGKRAHPRDRC